MNLMSGQMDNHSTLSIFPQAIFDIQSCNCTQTVFYAIILYAWFLFTKRDTQLVNERDNERF